MMGTCSYRCSDCWIASFVITSTASTDPTTITNHAALLPVHDRTALPASLALTASTASSSSCLLQHLARDAKRRVRKCLQPGQSDLLAATLAAPERVGIRVQSPQRPVNGHQPSPFLTREQKRLLPLH